MQIEMSIKGLMVDPVTNTPIVILRDKDGQKVLPIWVGIFEANAIALALRTRAPIFVEDSVIDNAKTVDFTTDKADSDRLHKWLESLDPEDLGKYKM
jgi:bifunctional DNase/RNase